VSCWTPFAVPLPVRSPLSPPPHRSSRPRSPSSTLHVHSTHMHSTYSRLLRSPPPPPPHALSPSPPGACASRAPCPLPSSPPTRAPSVPRRAPPCRRRRYPVRALRPAPPSAECRATGLHASTHTAPRLVNAEPRGRRARASVEPPLVPIACARALRVPRRCLGGSRRCLRFVRLCATNHLCKLQRKLVSNRKSKEWSMLGSGKHFAIGKKEARRVWYLRVDCACCPQEAVAPR
jgi:hypothetical protein